MNPEAGIFSTTNRLKLVDITRCFALSERMPEELKVTAISNDDVIMGIEHRHSARRGQFRRIDHLGLGEVGLAIIKNVIRIYAKASSSKLLRCGWKRSS